MATAAAAAVAGRAAIAAVAALRNGGVGTDRNRQHSKVVEVLHLLPPPEFFGGTACRKGPN